MKHAKICMCELKKKMEAQKERNHSLKIYVQLLGSNNCSIIKKSCIYVLEQYFQNSWYIICSWQLHYFFSHLLLISFMVGLVLLTNNEDWKRLNMLFESCPSCNFTPLVLHNSSFIHNNTKLIGISGNILLENYL